MNRCNVCGGQLISGKIRSGDKSHARILWKDDGSDLLEYFDLVGFRCKNCGHVDLIVKK